MRQTRQRNAKGRVEESQQTWRRRASRSAWVTAANLLETGMRLGDDGRGEEAAFQRIAPLRGGNYCTDFSRPSCQHFGEEDRGRVMVGLERKPLFPYL
jgi:hypothetical protein